MRTTVDLDESVVIAAKAIAREEGVSLGTVLSRLARTGMQSGPVAVNPKGFPVFAAGRKSTPITLEAVNEHRDDG